MRDKNKSSRKFAAFGVAITKPNPFAMPPLPKPVLYKPKQT